MPTGFSVFQIVFKVIINACRRVVVNLLESRGRYIHLGFKTVYKITCVRKSYRKGYFGNIFFGTYKHPLRLANPYIVKILIETLSRNFLEIRREIRLS